MNNLKNKGLSLQNLTLHVGAGTFRPVKSKTIANHEMHTEHFRISIETLKNIKNHKGPRIAVGTTSLRTLESLYWAGVLSSMHQTFHHIKQWTPYNISSSLSFEEALEQIINATKQEGKNFIEGSTAIIIVPGYKIRTIDALITNFHQPRSTLLLLVAAIIGDHWKKIYDHALNNDYRFLSYGDSSLLWRKQI
jgi:S-adenosylmethionine:tRNA ribosyltransferase-isomerase